MTGTSFHDPLDRLFGPEPEPKVPDSEPVGCDTPRVMTWIGVVLLAVALAVLVWP